MTLNVSPQTEAKLIDAAKRQGIDPSSLVEKLVRDYEMAANASEADTAQKHTAENDPLMARLEARLEAAPTDPDLVRDAEEDLAEFMRLMNATRREAGARIPYPEAR